MQLPWLVLVLFVSALVFDHLVIWPSFVKRRASHPTRARHALWAGWFAMLWMCAVLVLVAWHAQGTPLATLGLVAPTGWRLWVAVAGIVAIVGLQALGGRRVARMTGDKTPLRERMGSTAQIMPRDAAELPGWLVLSITAGFCEELLFRAFLFYMLEPVVGSWVAAASAVAVFAAAHAYQGREGLVRTAVMGAVFMALWLAMRSLWPGIVLHAALDFAGGWIGLLILRDPAAQGRR